MKKFILKVLLFFACVVVMDFAFGQFFSYLRAHAKGGSTANCEYIADRCQDDIIILGSSRATHHYVPQIFEDSLGVTCYNCGEEGNGVVLAYGRLKMLTNRYKPQLVLYEVTPGFDYGTKDPNNKYLGYLRAYYNKDGISDVFDDFDDDMLKLKMMSKMYQNTSRPLPIILDNLVFRDNNKGYDPLYGKLDVTKVKEGQKGDGITEIDSLKLSYVERIINLCNSNEIPLVFLISPWYEYGDDMREYEPAFELCKRYSVQVINSLNNLKFSHNKEFFQDDCHLNNDGAIEYTRSLLPIVRERLGLEYNN